jgi:hypothetical protein
VVIVHRHSIDTIFFSYIFFYMNIQIIRWYVFECAIVHNSNGHNFCHLYSFFLANGICTFLCIIWTQCIIVYIYVFAFLFVFSFCVCCPSCVVFFARIYNSLLFSGSILACMPHNFSSTFYYEMLCTWRRVVVCVCVCLMMSDGIYGALILVWKIYFLLVMGVNVCFIILVELFLVKFLLCCIYIRIRFKGHGPPS